MVEPDDTRDLSEGGAPGTAPDSPELPRLLGELTRVIESGARIDTEDYLRRYPNLAPDLKQFFKTRMLEGGDRDTGLANGSVIDDYRIVREIGRGGMGVVYEAEQISLGRRVALKVLPAAILRGKSAVDRFRREATAVARLSHPRIVAVHGFNQAGGLAYLAMEYVPGLDLAEIIDRLRTAKSHGRRFLRISGPQLDDQDISRWARGKRLIGTAPDDPQLADGIVIDLRNYAHMAAALAADAADALRHAHAHGVIHRDIKPSNLILSETGALKLSDFGLAKNAAEKGSLTQSGDFVGSPAYVSPEQAEAKRRPVDARSDIFSLGVTLYELVTLHQPFAAKSVAAILRNVAMLDPPLPTKQNPQLPRDLETIILKAIEKLPERRYQSAEALAEDLRHFLNFEPIAARPLSRVGRWLRLARRHKVRVLLVGMGLAILVLAALLATGSFRAQQRGATMVKDISELLRERGGGTLAVGVLEQLADDFAGLTAEERRQRLDLVVQDADERVRQGDFERVSELLGRLDAKVLIGAWDLLDRRLLESRVREIKLRLVQSLELALLSPPTPITGRQWRSMLSVLERLLEDREPLVCKNAAVALARVGASSSLGALLDALARRSDGAGRIALIEALRAFGDIAAVGVLADETRDSDPDVRYAALDALDALDPPDLGALVLHLAEDPEAWIVERQAAVRQRLADKPLQKGPP
ncbi:MAG: protein kinase domain-containing protein [Planctomycetota bacterium]